MKKTAVKITVTVLAAAAAILLAFHFVAVAVIMSEYDGGEGGFSDFLRAESELGELKLSDLLTKIRYKFTGKLSADGVVKGGDFLFPKDKEPFDYEADANGTLEFSDEESCAILEQMKNRQAAYALDGAEFFVFVVPNSQSVYKENVPFGDPSAVARAEKLSEYLKENGFENFHLLNEACVNASHETFHNTENAINEYGAYLSFQYIVSKLPEQITRRMNKVNIGEDDIRVSYSYGRSLAKSVCLERVIKNKNVYYDTAVLEAMYVKTASAPFSLCKLKDEYNDFLGSSCVLVESYDKYELGLMTPLFASAFTDTCFKDGLAYSGKAVQAVSPAAVVCLIREDRLNALLEDYDAETFNSKLSGKDESGVTEAPSNISVVAMSARTALIAGECERTCEVYIETPDGTYTVRGVYGRFFAEVPADLNEKTVKISSKANGKSRSAAVNATVRTYTGVSRDADVGAYSMLYYEPTVKDYTGSNLYSAKRLSYIKSGFVSFISDVRKKTGKKTNVIFLVAPDPLSVYPDAASEKHLAKRADYTRLDQVAAELSGVEGLSFIDLRAEMKMNTDIGKLYYQTDTHWTELGAYLGYRAVIGEISAAFPAATPYPLNAFTINETAARAGDLSSFAGLVGFTENVEFLTPTFSYKAVGVPEKPQTIDRSVYAGAFTSRTGNAALPSAIMIRDSYSANLFPLICEHFNTLYCENMWESSLNEEKLSEIRPDYIIIVCSERNLDTYVR